MLKDRSLSLVDEVTGCVFNPFGSLVFHKVIGLGEKARQIGKDWAARHALFVAVVRVRRAIELSFEGRDGDVDFFRRRFGAVKTRGAAVRAEAPFHLRSGGVPAHHAFARDPFEASFRNASPGDEGRTVGS